jgi:ATP-dependent DNA helicase RecQ
VHEGPAWVRTVNPWEPDSGRVAGVTAARRGEQLRMRDFVATGECLMRFLTRELDDPDESLCGRCANCVGEFVFAKPDERLVNEAVHYLRRAYRPIEPRKQWPPGLAQRRGRIPKDHQLQEGRALAIYGDTGWGQLVKVGKYGGDGFADELVEAMAEMIETDLQPDPFPTWVTAVPSRRSPDLVPGFARRLADRLRLPYGSALVKIKDAPQQKTMENSVQQARNAIGAFAAVPEQVRAEPVLLVDDMVDSGWSLTVCGVVLAEAGSGPVHPVVLGETTSGGA